jgi:hypothetical protein
MPARKKYIPIQVALVSDDQKRLSDMAASRNLTKSEVAREAIRWYLNAYDKLKNEKQESIYVAELKKQVDRMIAFWMPIRVESGTLYHLTYEATPPDVFEAAVNATKQRLRKKLTEEEQKLAAGVKKAIEQ